MPVANPYISRLPIQDPTYFFGRTTELRRLLDGLAAPGVQSFSVVGDRRIGKSSLLQQVLGAYRRHDPDTSETTRLLFHDFQRRCPADPTEFRAFVMKEVECSGCLRETGAHTLADLPEAAEERGVRLVFLWDEFEVALCRGAMDLTLLEELRACAATGTMAFITATNRDLRTLCNPQQADLAFFNIFNQVNLGPLDDESARALIERPSTSAGVPLAPHAKHLLRMGGNLPIYLQIACCACLEQLAHSRRARPDWERIEGQFLEEARQHLDYLVKTELSPGEIEVCRLVARKAQVPAEHAQDLRNLRRRGYVVTRGHGDELFSEMMVHVLPSASAPAPAPAAAVHPTPESIFQRFLRAVQQCNEILLYNSRAEAFPITEQLGELASLGVPPVDLSGFTARVFTLWKFAYDNTRRGASAQHESTLPEQFRKAYYKSLPVQALVCLRNHWQHPKPARAPGVASDRYHDVGEVFEKYLSGIRRPPETEAECAMMFCGLFDETCCQIEKLRDALKAAVTAGEL